MLLTVAEAGDLRYGWLRTKIRLIRYSAHPSNPFNPLNPLFKKLSAVNPFNPIIYASIESV